MKKNILLIVFTLLFLHNSNFSYSQNTFDIDEYKVEYLANNTIDKINSLNLQDNYDSYKNILDKFNNTTIEERDVIIYVSNYKNGDWGKVVYQKVLFMKNNNFPNYLYNINNIYIIAIGDAETKKTAKTLFDPRLLEVSISQLISKYQETLTGLIKILALPQTVLMSSDYQTNSYEDPRKTYSQLVTMRVIKINGDNVNDPSIIKITRTKENEIDKAQEFEYKIHENNYLQFKLGTSISNLTHKYYQLNDGYVIVSDSAKKEEIKTNLFFGFEIYPFGRNVDSYENLSTRNWLEGLGITLGLKLSTDPLESVMTGLSYTLFQDISLVGGYSWNLVDKNQTLNIGTISSIDDAKKYLKREYVGSYYLGLSFSPNSVIKALGLDNSKK